MNVKGGTQHQINLLDIRRWTLSAISATPAGGQHTPPLSDVTGSQGAQFEIRIDGTPRSRDRKDFAMEAARLIKNREPVGYTAVYPEPAASNLQRRWNGSL